MHLPPATLTLETIVLEPVGVGHAGEMAAVLSDPALYLHTGGVPPTAAELADRYRRLADGLSADGEVWLNWIVREIATGSAAGYVQATVEPQERAAELAWVIGLQFQGRGYATAGARAVAAWLAEAGVTRFEAQIHPANLASERVARAVGLAPTGRILNGERVWVSSNAAA